VNKLTKSQVKFEHPASMGDHCQDCKFYQGIRHSCEYVEGDIKPIDWCTLWKRKEKKNDLTQTKA